MAQRSNRNDISNWVGWVSFAGLLMVLSGVVQAIIGLVALFKEEVYGVGEAGVWVLDMTTWGWAHLIIGVFLLLAGAAVMSGKLWGRAVGVAFASLAVIGNFAFVPVQAVWSVAGMIVSLLVLYGLVVYGAEAQDSLE